tara:strand:- start:130 stop:1671 length:1542 start_codon:yes stop_codon:yes gene_type:complete
MDDFRIKVKDPHGINIALNELLDNYSRCVTVEKYNELFERVGFDSNKIQELRDICDALSQRRSLGSESIAKSVIDTYEASLSKIRARNKPKFSEREDIMEILEVIRDMDDIIQRKFTPPEYIAPAPDTTAPGPAAPTATTATTATRMDEGVSSSGGGKRGDGVEKRKPFNVGEYDHKKHPELDKRYENPPQDESIHNADYEAILDDIIKDTHEDPDIKYFQEMEEDTNNDETPNMLNMDAEADEEKEPNLTGLISENTSMKQTLEQRDKLIHELREKLQEKTIELQEKTIELETVNNKITRLTQKNEEVIEGIIPGIKNAAQMTGSMVRDRIKRVTDPNNPNSGQIKQQDPLKLTEQQRNQIVINTRKIGDGVNTIVRKLSNKNLDVKKLDVNNNIVHQRRNTLPTLPLTDTDGLLSSSSAREGFQASSNSSSTMNIEGRRMSLTTRNRNGENPGDGENPIKPTAPKDPNPSNIQYKKKSRTYSIAHDSKDSKGGKRSNMKRTRKRNKKSWMW